MIQEIASRLHLYTGSSIHKVDSVIGKIKDLSSLSQGWDFGYGDSIRPDVIKKAISLYINISNSTNNKFKTSVSPTSNGGIILTFSYNDDFIDIEVSDNLQLNIRHEKGVGEDYDVVYSAQNISFYQIISRLKKVCNWSEHFIFESTISLREGSIATPSIITEEAFQCLSTNALSTPAAAYVLI